MRLSKGHGKSIVAFFLLKICVSSPTYFPPHKEPSVLSVTHRLWNSYNNLYLIAITYCNMVILYRQAVSPNNNHQRNII